MAERAWFRAKRSQDVDTDDDVTVVARAVGEYIADNLEFFDALFENADGEGLDLIFRVEDSSGFDIAGAEMVSTRVYDCVPTD